MKKAIWTLSAMALIGFGMAACEEEDGNGGLLPTVTDSWDKCSDTLPDPNNPGKFAKYKVEDVNGKHACSSYQECADDRFTFLKDQNSDIASCVNDNRDVYCENTASCEQGETCDPVDHICIDENDAPDDFKFVRIDDANEIKYASWDADKNCAKIEGKSGCVDDPGADIDAVVLTKSNGEQFHATDVYDYVFGYAEAAISYKHGETKTFKLATNPLNIKEAPDSLINYGDDTKETICYLYTDEDASCFGDGQVNCQKRPFVSLGGKGGYIIVEMGGAIEADDTLDIVTVSNCKMQHCDEATDANCGKAVVDDKVTVYVSVSDDTNKEWKIVGDGSKEPNDKGVISYKISADMLGANDVVFE